MCFLRLRRPWGFAIYGDGITEANITNAIEEFERTLVTPNSAFDKWLKGDNEALTAEELRGYELFKEYNCATCHVGANLGGESYELMGLRRHYFADRGLELTNEDNGRYKETQEDRDRHRFKVPGLRNIKLHTPMYFFLSHLSFVDFCCSSIIAPKTLVNLLAEDRTTSFWGCMVQFFLVCTFVVTELILFAVMAYDGFVAICNPLLYTVVMCQRLCAMLVVTSYAWGVA